MKKVEVTIITMITTSIIALWNSFRNARNLMRDPHGWERTAVVCGGSSQGDLNILNKMIFIYNVT